MCVNHNLKPEFFQALKIFLFPGIGLSAAPAYAVEMSLPSMKGNVALINQLFQSFSFIIAQVVGYMELLGNEEQWHLLLGRLSHFDFVDLKCHFHDFVDRFYDVSSTL